MGANPHQPRTLRSLALALAIVVGAVVAVVAVPGSAAAATSSCPTVYWGSLAKTSSRMTTEPIVGVRTGIHPCYDRVVVDLAGADTGRLGFDVRYVTAVHREGIGTTVALRGAADIQIVVRAPGYNIRTGAATFRPANPNELTGLAGYPVLRQLAYAGSFEGQTTIGLGVRARLPMRVFVLPGPGTGQRLVIDVYQHW